MSHNNDTFLLTQFRSRLGMTRKYFWKEEKAFRVHDIFHFFLQDITMTVVHKSVYWTFFPGYKMFLFWFIIFSCLFSRICKRQGTLTLCQTPKTFATRQKNHFCFCYDGSWIMNSNSKDKRYSQQVMKTYECWQCIKIPFFIGSTA